MYPTPFRLAISLGLILTALSVSAQTELGLPDRSQAAMVQQHLGVTDITIRYHRPLVDGRKIWGGLVPFGKVWRAGANFNTTFEVSDWEGTIAALKAKGVPFHTEPARQPWGWWAEITDPDGNGIGLHAA